MELKAPMVREVAYNWPLGQIGRQALWAGLKGSNKQLAYGTVGRVNPGGGTKGGRVVSCM